MKDKVLKLRLSDADNEIIRQRAAADGMTVSAWIRWRLVGQGKPVPVAKKPSPRNAREGLCPVCARKGGPTCFECREKFGSANGRSMLDALQDRSTA